jgi:hypothetical protein
MRRIGIPLSILLYLGFWGVMSLQITDPTDFDVFFLPSAKIALAGHPLDIYQVRYDGNYPNANGPLSMLPLTLLAAVAQRFGFINNFTGCRMFVAIGFAIFSLLLSREAVLTLDLLLPKPLHGIRRFLAYCVFALSPELWHSVLGYGHIEHPLMLWMLLAGVRSLMLRRPTRAGLFLGLALLTRSSAILYLLPLTLLLLRGRDWSGALRFVGCAALTLGLGLLPFALADRADLIYSLVSFHAGLPVGGGSLWGALGDSPLVAIGDHYDSEIVLGAALLFTLLVLAFRRDLRLGKEPLEPGAGAIYALLAIAGLCFPLFLKTLWPYYYLDTYMLLALWWLSMARNLNSWGARIRWCAGAVLPLSAVFAGQLAETGLTAEGTNSWTQQWSLIMTIVTASMIAVILLLLWYGSHSSTRRMRGGEATEVNDGYPDIAMPANVSV